jgi:hypothetical protein
MGAPEILEGHDLCWLLGPVCIGNSVCALVLCYECFGYAPGHVNFEDGIW